MITGRLLKQWAPEALKGCWKIWL